MRLVLSGGRVFDGTGTAPFAADVAIEDDRFVAVGHGLTGDVSVDVTGRTVLPGLINTHVHVMGTSASLEQRLRMPFSYQFYAALPILHHLLSCGITWARDLAGADDGVRKAVREGLVRGPRLQVAIEALSPTGGHIDAWLPSGQEVFEYYLPHPSRPHGVADGPVELRRLVRTLIRGGADVIKICTTDGGVWPRDDHLPAHFRDDELAAVIEEARNSRKPVAAHAIGLEGAKNAIRAGVDSIEHGVYLDDEAVSMMAERGTYYVPTLTRVLGPLDNADVAERLGAEEVGWARKTAEAHTRSFQEAIRAGVKIAMGTDMHGGEFLDELYYMNKLGLSPEQTLVASTSAAADLMRISDDYGSIAEGKKADLVVLAGDPYDFVDMRSRIDLVYQDGTEVFRHGDQPGGVR